jgi:hypothetical protein
VTEYSAGAAARGDGDYDGPLVYASHHFAGELYESPFGIIGYDDRAGEPN